MSTPETKAQFGAVDIVISEELGRTDEGMWRVGNYLIQAGFTSEPVYVEERDGGPLEKAFRFQSPMCMSREKAAEVARRCGEQAKADIMTRGVRQ